MFTGIFTFNFGRRLPISAGQPSQTECTARASVGWRPLGLVPRGGALCVALWISGFGSPVAQADEGVGFFEKRIRPVLIESCYECHSEQAASAGKLKGGLKLDSRDASRQGGESGPAVVPKDIDGSLLMSALRHRDGLEMPPEKKLPAHIVADFAQWIEMGAPDPRDAPSAVHDPSSKPSWWEQRSSRHWAYDPPRLSSLPRVKDTLWPRTAADFFILAELERHGISPAPLAAKRERIRRVTFDLIGLPPTTAEVEAFLRDESPLAFHTVVDRLLASPHYGERWGRWWLDVARYADDKALAYHNPWPHAYRYRDWVVSALNEDMPYDQFVRLQLAGDLLPEPIQSYPRRLAGLGFQGLGAFYHKGSVPKQVMADELDDRVDTLSRGLLGLTVACARCHDHKYDPITTADYYSLAAAYNGAEWSEVKLAPPEAVQAYASWVQQRDKIQADNNQWLEEQGRQIGRQAVQQLEAYLHAAWQIHSAKSSGVSVDEAAEAERRELHAYFLARCGRLLTKSDAEIDKLPSPLARWVRTAKQTVPALAAGELANAPPEAAGDLPEPLRRATNEFVTYALVALEPPGSSSDQRPTGAGNDDGGPAGKELAAERDLLRKALWLDKEAPFGFSSAQEIVALLDEGQHKEYSELTSRLEQHNRLAPPEPPAAHGVVGGGLAMHIYVRGNVERAGDLATPGFLPVLRRGEPAVPAASTFTRLQLADAICTPRNPLTARVLVNRVWQQHFGRGIVATASNFGELGERPTHPELLDTLAVQFMEAGWSLKWLHRQIVHSAAYQLASSMDGTGAAARAVDPLAVDPENRLLWRFAARRLDVESWRDAVLSVSGQLARTIGGPAVGRAEEGHLRRTIYSTISRREPDPMLVAFDFPDANVTVERRTVTTVPQQQLFVMNSDFMLQAARALAHRCEAEASDVQDRIRLAYAWAFSRQPTQQELEFACRFLESPAESETSDQLTRYEQFCQAILAANEFSWID